MDSNFTKNNIRIITLDNNAQIQQSVTSAFNVENLLYKTKTHSLLNTSDLVNRHHYSRLNKYISKTSYTVFATILHDGYLYADTDRDLVITMADMERDKLLQKQNING